MPASRHATKTPESDTHRAPIQHKQGTAMTDVMAAAEHGLSGGGGALPFAERIQHSFGRHSVTGVVAHTGGAARQANESMGSMGYATGNHVAFRGAPDLHTAAHEAAHVIQQRAGVSLKGGVGESGDRYERHADAVAERVVQGKSAEDLLDQYAGGSAGHAVQRRHVQHNTRPASQSPLAAPSSEPVASGAGPYGPPRPSASTQPIPPNTNSRGDFEDTSAVGHESMTLGSPRNGATLSGSTANGGSIQVGREFPMQTTPAVVPTPVPGVFLTLTPELKLSITGQAQGLNDPTQAARQYQAAITGSIRAGVEIGAPPAASGYVRFGPQIQAQAQLSVDGRTQRPTNATASLSLDATATLGVQLGNGAIDHNIELARANIGRFNAFTHDFRTGRSHFGGWQMGAGLRAAIDEIQRRLGRSPTREPNEGTTARVRNQ